MLSTDKSEWIWWTVLAVVLTIPISQNINIKILLLACVFSIFIRGSNEEYIACWKRSWDLFLYIGVILIGLIHSEDIMLGLGVLEKNLSCIALPFIFSRMGYIDEKRLKSIFNSFALGLTIACVICLVNAVIIYSKTNNIQSFFFYNLLDIIGYQPTYFAYYLIFAITYFLHDLYSKALGISIFFKSLFILFWFFILMLTGGQTAFIGLLLVFAFFILKFLTEERSTERKIGAFLVGFMLVCMFFTILISNRNQKISLTDAWDRIVVWKSAIDAIPNPIFGVGTGDYKIILNEYYLSHNLQKFAKESYNSHNQFIQILFTNGLLGLVSILLLIGRPLYLSLKRHNSIGILLIYPFLVYGMTEVFLGRYQGIIFFVLVHQMCLVSLQLTQNEKYEKTP